MHTYPYVERTESDGVIVLIAVGEFDLGSVEVLRTAFGGALADQHRIVLNLSQTTFIDSTGLSVLVAAGKRAVRDGGWVRLVSPLPNVRKLLRITALDTVIGLYDSVEQARGFGADQLAES